MTPRYPARLDHQPVVRAASHSPTDTATSPGACSSSSNAKGVRHTGSSSSPSKDTHTPRLVHLGDDTRMVLSWHPSGVHGVGLCDQDGVRSAGVQRQGPYRVLHGEGSHEWLFVSHPDPSVSCQCQ